MNYLESLPPAIMILVQIFIVVTIILWALLPFAVFGLKSRLDKLNNTAQYILNELERKTDIEDKSKEKRIEPQI